VSSELVLQESLGGLIVLGAAVWATRIALLRLTGVCNWLFVFMVFVAVRDAAGMVAYPLYVDGTFPKVYRWYWLISRLLTSTLLLAVIIEMYVHVLNRYRGLQRLGELVLKGMLAGVALLIFALVVLDPGGVTTWTRFWLSQERNVYVGLTFLLCALVLVPSFFHVALPRNTKVVGLSLTLIVGGEAVSWSLVHLFTEGMFWRDLSVSVLYVLSLWTGALLFSRTSEETDAAPQPVPAANGAAERLALQGLKELNRALLKVLRP